METLNCDVQWCCYQSALKHVNHVFFHIVVCWTKEDGEDSLHFPVGVDVEFVREWLVVQARATRFHAKLLQSVSRFRKHQLDLFRNTKRIYLDGKFLYDRKRFHCYNERTNRKKLLQQK